MQINQVGEFCINSPKKNNLVTCSGEAVAVNAFVCVMNPAVSNKCPFCGSVETIFIVF